jgi:hypothetical protein
MYRHLLTLPKLLGGKAMAQPPNRQREERLQIMLNDEELVALDDFRFKRRMPT